MTSYPSIFVESRFSSFSWFDRVMILGLWGTNFDAKPHSSGAVLTIMHTCTPLSLSNWQLVCRVVQRRAGNKKNNKEACRNKTIKTNYITVYGLLIISNFGLVFLVITGCVFLALILKRGSLLGLAPC